MKVQIPSQTLISFNGFSSSSSSSSYTDFTNFPAAIIHVFSLIMFYLSSLFCLQH